MLEKIVEAFETEKENRKLSLLAKAKEDFQLTSFLTDTEKARIKTGVMKLEKAEAKIISRIEKYLIKQTKDDILLLSDMEELAINDVKVTSIDITVDWKHSATWGKNPIAEITVHTVNKDGETNCYSTKGTASGCGYDKESTAVAIALNDIPAVLMTLALQKNNISVNENRELFGYGVSGLIPKFDGGVGMSTICNVITKSFNLKLSEKHAKTADWYSFY